MIQMYCNSFSSHRLIISVSFLLDENISVLDLEGQILLIVFFSSATLKSLSCVI